MEFSTKEWSSGAKLSWTVKFRGKRAENPSQELGGNKVRIVRTKIKVYSTYAVEQRGWEWGSRI